MFMKLSQFMGDDQFVIEFISIFQGDTSTGSIKSISFIPIFMGDIYIYMRSAVPANPTGVVVFSPWGPPNRVS